ncbi:hypothetical protein [Thermoflavifilum thermophilum]|uniref:hypothetical protein n=1 Tax=Thermoflavifilum thermophilum TaxID=1393122 RepID=UPI00116055CE|nr:hypothetical protein [Thermoflavifilum thermophilum]
MGKHVVEHAHADAAAAGGEHHGGGSIAIGIGADGESYGAIGGAEAVAVQQAANHAGVGNHIALVIVAGDEAGIAVAHQQVPTVQVEAAGFEVQHMAHVEVA